MTDRDGRSDAVRAELLGGGVEPIVETLEELRVLRIATEAAQAFREMGAVRRAVAIFGSAQELTADKWGALGREIARGLAEADFAVITGGGPGLMAATNEGALQAGGTSVGLTIHLPDDEPPNEFLTLTVPFHYFFLRKLVFVKYACAFILLPGGYGTLDELFEALNLLRTHRLDPFPVILVGSEYWAGLVAWLRSTAVAAGTLAEEDLGLLSITDDPVEVVRIVVDCHATLCRTLGIDA
jgi:uncharacterized protein (TIGR00730 family)